LSIRFQALERFLNNTMKRLLVTFALAAKALTLAGAVLLYAGSADTANSEDCNPCIPPPSCLPDCWGEES
jgi:hypothetical protein